MRTVLTIASLTAILAGVPVMSVAAEGTAITQPAVNSTFLTGASSLVEKLMGQAGGALNLAKQAAAIPFAGSAAKGQVDTAQSQVDTATKLTNELTGLSQGKAPGAGSILGSLSDGSGPSLSERFKGLPLADTVQTVLGNKEITGALLKGLPLDKIPGYAVASQALSTFVSK
jgi:hypothetical protein